MRGFVAMAVTATFALVTTGSAYGQEPDRLGVTMAFPQSIGLIVSAQSSSSSRNSNYETSGSFGARYSLGRHFGIFGEPQRSGRDHPFLMSADE